MIKKSKTPKNISTPDELITPEDHNNKKKYTAKEKKAKQKKEDKDKRFGLKVPKTVQDTIPYKSMYENGNLLQVGETLKEIPSQYYYIPYQVLQCES